MVFIYVFIVLIIICLCLFSASASVAAFFSISAEKNTKIATVLPKKSISTNDIQTNVELIMPDKMQAEKQKELDRLNEIKEEKKTEPVKTVNLEKKTEPVKTVDLEKSTKKLITKCDTTGVNKTTYPQCDGKFSWLNGNGFPDPCLAYKQAVAEGHCPKF
jgi:hypothetical protein